MIFPLGIRGYCNRKQPAKCHLTNNETVQIKKCKLVRAIKTKRCQTNRCKTRVVCRVLECLCSALAFLSQIWWEYFCILWRAKIMYVHGFLVWI